MTRDSSQVLDLNNYLFEQMERLNKIDVNDKNINTEIERAKAIALTASQIISNINTQLRVEYAKNTMALPKGDENGSSI